MKEIKTKEEFKSVINNKVLIDFYAEWCGPCKMLKPVLERVEESLEYEIYELNVDNLQSIAMKYGVMSIPYLALFENGKIKKEATGFKTEDELKEFLKDA